MARRSEGWKTHTDPRSGTIYVRFRHDGQRYNLSCGTGEPKAAGIVAARIYGEIVAGTRKKAVQVQRVDHDVEITADRWLNTTREFSDSTRKTYAVTVMSVFPRFFKLTKQLTSEQVTAMLRQRMREVTRSSALRELATVMAYARWCVDEGYLSTLPEATIPRGEGTRVMPREIVELSPDEVVRILAALPESSRHGNPARAFLTALYETGLRYSALCSLSAPDDYLPGRATVRIRRENDKTRYAREIPISDAARAALDSVCPESGPIFGRIDYRDTLRKAATAAGLSPQRVARLSYHDLRHARTTHLLSDPNANLLGVAYLVGHRRVTTTDRYARPNQRAATELLRSIGSHSGRTADTISNLTVNKG